MNVILYSQHYIDSSTQKQSQKIFTALQHQKIQYKPLSQFYPSPTWALDSQSCPVFSKPMTVLIQTTMDGWILLQKQMPLFDFRNFIASRRVLATGRIVSEFSFCNSLFAVSLSDLSKIAIKFAVFINLPSPSSVGRNFSSFNASRNARQCKRQTLENSPLGILSSSNNSSLVSVTAKTIYPRGKAIM